MYPWSRPTQIERAVILLAFSLVVSFLKLGLDYDYIASLAPIQSTIAVMIITVLVMLFIYYKIWTGRNWARIIFTVFFIIGILPTLLILPAEVNRNALVFLASIVQILAQVLAIIYMFLPVSNAWFKSIKQAKSA